MGGPSAGELDDDSETYKALIENGVPRPNAKQFIKQLPLYWGEQSITSGPTYWGAISCFLFIMGLFLIRGAMIWWVVPLTILSIMLGWGKHLMWFTDLFLDYVPLYDKFRAVSTTLVIGAFTVTFFGIYTLHKALSGEIEQQKVIKSLKNALYLCGGLLAVFLLIGGSLFEFIGLADSQLPEWNSILD